MTVVSRGCFRWGSGKVKVRFSVGTLGKEQHSGGRGPQAGMGRMSQGDGGKHSVILCDGSN